VKDNEIYLGDCLELMKDIPNNSIDMILCDLPYGITACKWDTVIPFTPLWTQYKRIIKPKGAVVLTASQPFTSALVMSNPKWFRYEWIWEKNNGTNFLDVKRKPFKVHENILIFSKNGSNYYPIKTKGHSHYTRVQTNVPEIIVDRSLTRIDTDNKGDRYPRSVQRFPSIGSRPDERGLHPTQKPVSLFEYLIKTYTLEGEVVLDNCAGSGTTAIASINTNRRYICMELDEKYYNVMKKRIESHSKQLSIG